VSVKTGSGSLLGEDVSEPDPVLGAEAAMTAKYEAAKGLAAKGGEVTIKGNASLRML